MDGMDAGVMDAPEVDLTEGVEEVEQGVEEVEGAELEREAATPDAKDDPYTTRFSREMRAALKQWEQANPEAAKYAKQARDNHARLFALNQLEPKGIDGVRERYALLEAIGGTEGLTGLQERLAGVQEVDTLLAAGDPTAFDKLGPELTQGLAKLMPNYLDRVAQADPQAFERGITPHVVNALASSPIIANFNALVDVLNTTNDPRLDDKAKLQYTLDSLRKMSEGFNALAAKAGEAKAAPMDEDRQKFEQQRSEFEKQQQEAHWKQNINPHAVAHENAKFEEMFKPYQNRLKLNPAAKADLMQSFKSGMAKAGASDAEYQRQMKIYRGQKNPDAAAVTNFVKTAITRHSKNVFDGLIQARYGSFLAGKPKVATPAKQAASPASPGVEVRTVRPADGDIDWRATGRDGVWNNRYVLKNGKTIQVRQ